MTDQLPTALYRAAQIRQMDAAAVELQHLSGITLMKRAGRALFDAARRTWPERRKWLVLAGSGNNAGDGYVVAALAAERKLPVMVLWVSDPRELKGDALKAYEYAVREGVAIEPFNGLEPDHWRSEETLLVDALLGTGIKGPVREAFIPAIEWLNQQKAPVISADIPSGLCADTGVTLGTAVRAALTVTFVALKAGLFTGRGPALTGKLVFDDLGIPEDVIRAHTGCAQRIDLRLVEERPPTREADAHKGRFGHLLVVGGDHGFGGAALLAAEAALWCGTALVGLATRAEHVTAALVRRPELMALGVPSGQELAPWLEKPGCFLVGPGLGQSPWSEQLLQQVLGTLKPLVLDADALNILARGRLRVNPEASTYVLTPHPGEAARLLDCAVGDIEADRFAAVERLQQTYGGVVVLKGAGTLICDGRGVYLASVGNPGLAKGGSGDVLAGVIAALLAQGLAPSAAARLGVCVHGAAADLLVEDTGVAGLLPSELAPYLRELLN